MDNDIKLPQPSGFENPEDFAPMDFSFSDPIGDERAPAKPVKEGVEKAFRTHLTNENNLRKYVNRALPEEYSRIFEAGVKVKSTAQDAIEDIKDATRKPTHDMAKLLSTRIPKRMKRTQKLLDWIKESTDSYEFDRKSQAKIDSDETQAAISGLDAQMQQLLSAQTEIAQENQQRDEERDTAKRAEDLLLFGTQNRILAAVQKDTSLMSRYAVSVDLDHKRKSLSAFYRMAFGIRDLNTKLNELTELSRVHLKGIQHNTGLPEEQKLRFTERGAAQLKNRFINRTIGRFTDGSDSFIDSFLTRAGKNIKESAQMTGDAIRQASFMTDMVTDNQDDFSGMSEEEQSRKRYANMLASFAMDAIGPRAVGKGMNKLREKNPALEKILKKYGSKGAYAVDNAHSLAKNFAYGDDPDDGAVKKALRWFVGMGLPSTDQDSQVDVATGSRLNDATYTDQMMRRAQVEVMPGLLAMMLRELQFARTGRDPGLLQFDYQRGGFKTQSQAKLDILGSMRRNAFTKSNMDTLTKDITEGMTEEDKLALQKHLLMKRRSGSTMTDRTLMNENFFDYTEDKEKRKELAGRFAKFMDSEGGKFSDSAQANERRQWFFSNLDAAGNYASDNRAAIQQAANEGQLPLLREMGLINEKNQITKEAMYIWDLMGDPDTGSGPGRLPGQPRGINPRMNALLAAQQQQQAGVLQQQQQMQQRPRAPAQNINFKGYSQRGIEGHTYGPIREKIKVDGVSHDSVVAGRVDTLHDTIKLLQEQHGKSLQEISENTSRLGIYYLQGSELMAGQSGDMKQKKFWDKSLKDHMQGVQGRMKNLTGTAWRGVRGGLNAARDIVTGDNAVTGWVRSLKSMGAKYLGEMRDGIPSLGDIYVHGRRGVAISKAMLRSGALRDSAGKVLRTLKDVAEAAGDIYDENQEVVLAEGDRLKTYLRANGLTMVKEWTNFLMKAGKVGLSRLKTVGENLFGFGQSLGKRLRSAGEMVGTFALEVIAPTKDVYVRGETNARGEREPKLFASLLRKGWYRDAKSGRTIHSETQIKGPLLDPDDNVALSAEDITRGLEDIDGKPIRSVRELAADLIRNNIKNTIRQSKAAIKTVKGAVTKAIKTVTKSMFRAGQTINKFLRFGASGFGSSAELTDAANQAAQDTGVAHGMMVALLTQIRDLLAKNDEALNGGGSAGGGMLNFMQRLRSRSKTLPPAASSGPTGDTSPPSQQTAPNYRSVSLMNAPGNIFGAAAGALGSAKAAGLGLLSKLKRGRKGGIKDLLKGGDKGGSVSKEDLQEALKQSREDNEKANKQSLRERMRNMKQEAVARVKQMRGGPSAEGEEEREGSVANLRKKFSNTFRNFKDEREHHFEDYGTRNSLDLLMEGITNLKNKGKELLEDASDYLPDRDGRRSKTPRGKPDRVLRRKGVANRLAKRAARTAASVGGEAAAGVAGRQALKAVGGWGIKKALLAGGGALLGVLGSPAVATALGVAGAIWTGKELYNWFKSNPRDVDNPKPGNRNEILSSIRMVEYGVGLDNPQLMARLRSFEAMVEPAVRGETGSLSVDINKIDASKALALFGITTDNGEQVDNFLAWLEARFKPTFLKWMDFSKVSGKALADLDKLEDEKRLKILEETQRTNTGWDQTESPFSGSPLAITTQAVLANIANARDLLSKKAQGDKPNGKDDIYKPEKNMPFVAAKAKEAEKRRAEAFQGKLVGLREAGSAGAAIEAAKSASSFSSLKSGKYSRATYGTIDEITSVRMRAYGFPSVNAATLMATEAMEQAAQAFITYDNSGYANYNGDTAKLLEAAAQCYGFSVRDESQANTARVWLEQRFLPVFIEFCAAMRVNAGKLAFKEGLEALSPSGKVAVATAILAKDDIWGVRALPLPGLEALTDPSEAKVYLERLTKLAQSQTLVEQSKTPPVVTQGVNNSYQTVRNLPTSQGPAKPQQTSYGSSPSAVKKAMSPDSEAEPQGSSAGGAGSTPSRQTLPGLTIADGNLYDGKDADQYLQLRNGATLDGLQPQVKQLLLGMIQEFGTHTGLTVGVNAGFRSFEEQSRLYQANPQKAAKPGGSLHEVGLAVDIDSATLDKMEKMGLMRKYGFTRPVGGETWHIEPAGIQGNIGQARANPNAFAQAILAGVGKGGGGAGVTKNGFPMGRRDTQGALATQAASAQPSQPEKESKVPDGAIAPPKLGMASANGTAGPSTAFAGAPSGDNKSLYSSLPESNDKESAKKLVAEAAKAVGVDPGAAMIKVNMESGFNGNAQAHKGSAKGLWQFTPGTWSDTMRKHGARFGIPENATPSDTRANAILGAQFTKDNLEKAAERGEPTDPVANYSRHLFGNAGARRFLAMRDDEIASETMSKAAAEPGNRNIFFEKDGTARSKAQVMLYLKTRMDNSAKEVGAQSYASESNAPTMSAARPAGVPQSRPQREVSGPVFTPPAMQQIQDRPAAPRSESQVQLLSKHIENNVEMQKKQLTAIEVIRDCALDIKKMLESKLNSVANPSAAPAPADNAGSGVTPIPSAPKRAISPPLV